MRCMTLGVLMLFLLVGNASAMQLVSDGDTQPLQRWADAAKVPTPKATVQSIRAPCPTGNVACANVPWYGALGTIYWDPAAATRAQFLHEVGHHFDYEMAQWARDRFRALIGETREWRSSPNSPHEKFAEAYSWCARHEKLRRAPQAWIFDYRPSPRLHRQACRIIRAAGNQARGT